MEAAVQATRILAEGFAYVESPRWHDGRLWFAHWGTGEIVAVDLDGRAEVVGRGREGLGWSIDWLPDGRLLVTGETLSVQQPDGTLTEYADLSGLGVAGWNEIVVDGRGNVYVNGMNFDFLAGEAPQPGVIALVTPDGEVRQVADGIEFGNGMAVTPDNATLIVAESFAGRLTAFDIEPDGGLANRRVWADGLGPDGICMDAEGAVWSHSGESRAHTENPEDPAGVAVRVFDGGKITHRVPLEQFGFACMLGGPDGRTLFLLVADWRGIEGVESALADRTGQVLVADAPAPGAGWP
jgi:sugar lactone lactonase YvrE